MTAKELIKALEMNLKLMNFIPIYDKYAFIQ